VGGVTIGCERCYDWKWEVLQSEVRGVAIKYETIGGGRCYNWR